jgi:hypothetical protein
MLYTPPRIQNQTNLLLGTSVWLARFHWYRRCVRPWSRWGSLWGTISVHSSRFQMGMARRHKKRYKNTRNPNGRLTNSDLEMTGLLMLWFVIEGVCPDLCEKRIALFSDNTPMVSWVTRLASKRSMVAEHLVQALALCLKAMHACPLTPMHIKGKCNAIGDIPSQSFGSNPAWMCASDSDLLTLFNNRFPLPEKHSWTVYRPNCAVAMHLISALRMKPFVLDDWRQLPTRGKCDDKIGAPTSNTCWAWIRIYNKSHIPHGSDVSQDLQPEHEQVTMGTDDRSRVARSLALSRPLARRSLWPATKTQQRY